MINVYGQKRCLRLVKYEVYDPVFVDSHRVNERHQSSRLRLAPASGTVFRVSSIM